MPTVSPTSPIETLSPRGTRARLQRSLLLLGAAVAVVLFLSFWIKWVEWQSGPGVSKTSGDFVSFWTAGRLALEGQATDAYRPLPHFLKQLELHGDVGWGYLSFFYPPFFLLLCAGFALFGYFSALCLWLATTLACFVATLRAILPTRLREGVPAWLLLLGYPAVMVNAGYGQNGFLSASLLGGAALWLDRRPALAGVLVGCLAYKPQLGIIVPLALAVARRWRCFAFAAATVLVLSAAATLIFGLGVWPGFLAGMTEAKRNWMEPLNPLYLQYWITVFGAMRMHGASLPLAYGAQALVTATAALALVFVLLRRPPGARSGMAEVAAIAACVPFCSPFMLEYDLVIVAVPMAWILREALPDGFRRGEVMALVGVYLAPVLFKITAFEGVLKLAVIPASALLFAVVLCRMMAQKSA